MEPGLSHKIRHDLACQHPASSAMSKWRLLVAALIRQQPRTPDLARPWFDLSCQLVSPRKMCVDMKLYILFLTCLLLESARQQPNLRFWCAVQHFLPCKKIYLTFLFIFRVKLVKVKYLGKTCVEEKTDISCRKNMGGGKQMCMQ